MTDAESREPKDDPKIYEEFDAFLKAAIYEFYRTKGKSRTGSFIALVVASGEIASIAVDAVRAEGNLKRLAIGAAGVVALRFGLRYALSGPLGVLLAAGTAASLIAYFVRNRREVTSKVKRYRELVADVRVEYDKLQSDHRDGRLSDDQRSLMVDGLMKRFLTDVD